MNWKSIGLGLLYIGLQYSSLWAGDQLTVNRDRAVFREGPGSYFPAIAELAKGTSFEVLTEENGWYKTTLGGKTGYLSTKVTAGKKESRTSQDVFAKMGTQQTGTKVAQSGVSAAVKGFANKFTQRLQGDPAFLDKAYAYHIDPVAYREFRRQTYLNRDLRTIRRAVDLPPAQGRLVFTFSEEGMGTAVAAKISQLGIYENTPVQDYVNYVGNLVAEASNAYDISFKFFILDQDAVNAYACPGGIVFVTRGALQSMQNEAELACFLGHEITHVVRRHGMKEMEKRKVMITADNAFAELDQSTGPDTETEATTADLESIALESYENIFAGRLQKYEDEADRFGLTFATRAGYDPHAMVDLLARLSGGQQDSGNDHYTATQNAERRKKVEHWLSTHRFPGVLETFPGRFQQNTASLH